MAAGNRHFPISHLGLLTKLQSSKALSRFIPSPAQNHRDCLRSFEGFPFRRGRRPPAAMASSSTTSPSPVQEQQDRISALPDSILLLILSFLPTLDAVRTSVLATRWRTLWTSVGALDFDEEYDGDFFFSGTGGRTVRGTKRKREIKSGFVEFVGKVLSFHHTPTLHKLRLSYCSHNCPLQDWIRTAVSRGVQTLDLRLPWHSDPDGKVGRLPSLLFTSQSLVELRLDLDGSALFLPGTMALVGLRRLRLCYVRFCDDHSTRALFSSSTALRSLALENCDYEKLGCLEISSCSLQELAIKDDSLEEEDDDLDGLDSCQVKIAAPHLTSFVYVASVAHAYVVEPLVCVEYVKIQFRRFEAWKEPDKHSIFDRVSSFLCSFSSARNLDMCPMCVEALSPFRRQTSEILYIFRNLNVLRMEVKYLDYDALRVILDLLLLNPHLRALIVEVRGLSVLPFWARKEDFLKLVDACSFESINRVVERVEIRYNDSIESNSFSSREKFRYTTETVLELVRFLLESQAHLKKLVLSTDLFWDKQYYPKSTRDAVIEKVLAFPKRTRELAVVFI